MNENKVISSHYNIDNEEIHLDYFSLKFFNYEKIILSIQEKKMVVLFNEVFQINDFQYVIFNSKEKINLLKNHGQNENKFEHLILGQIQCFLFQYIKNFFSLIFISKKILFQYVKNVLIILFIFLFLIKNDHIESDKNANRKSIQRQRNIYNTYQIISKEALPEMNAMEEKSIQNKLTFPTHKIYKNEKKAEKILEKPFLKLKKNTLKIKKEDDHEIQFFLHLKERK